MAIEEGLETTGKRVTINNFFESIQDIDEIANNAIKSVTDQGSIIDGLTKAIEEIKLEIKEIKAYIMVQEDEEKDRLLEEQDAEQKREMTERALSLQGVDSSDQRTAGSPEDQGVSFAENAQQKNVTNPQEQKGFFGSLAGLFGSSLLQLPAALLGAGSNNLNLVQNLNKGGKVNDTDNDKTNNDEDSVPAMLTPGEFVITKDAVEKVGVDTLKGINAAAGGTNKPEEIKSKEVEKKSGFFNKLLGRNKDNGIKVFEEGKEGSDFYEKTTEDFSGAGFDITTETTTKEDTGDSTITTTEVLRERAVSVGVPDLIEHKNQLLGEIHKLKGFEKVTIDDVIDGTTGIPDDKLFEIINQSKAAKATEKKVEEARKEDFKARNIKPEKGFSISAEDEVAKSLAGTIGYRIGQINPDQKVFGIEEFTTKTTEVFKSENDPKFIEAHANAKKGAKGFSEGGLVGDDIGTELPGLGGGGGGTDAITSKAKTKTFGNYAKDLGKISTMPFRALLGMESPEDPNEKFASSTTPDVVGEKLKNFAEQFKMDENMNVNLEGLLGEEKGKKMNKVFGGFLNMIKDDVIPNMKEEKLESGAKSILQKGLSSIPVDKISDDIEKSDMPEGVKTLFTDIFGGDKIEKMIEGVSTDINQDGNSVFKQEGKVDQNQSSFDSKIKNTLEDLFGTVLTPPETSKIITNSDQTSQGSVDQNKPVTVQANPAQVSDVEIKMTETVIPFMKLIQNDKIQVSKNDSIKNLAKNIT